MRSLASNVQEVNTHTIDGSTKVGKCVEHTLLAAPIKRCLPVIYQFFYIVKIRAVIPSRIGNLIGPARLSEPLLKVVELLLWNGNGKRLNGHEKMLLSFRALSRVVNRL